MTLSAYGAGKILDHIVGKTSFTMPTIYLLLKTAGGVEPTIGTNGYTRKQVAGADFNAAGVDKVIENVNALAFPASTGAWASGAALTQVYLSDAATAGNEVAYGTLSTARTVDASGITLTFAAGALVLTAT
jgi:hypothetical protein